MDEHESANWVAWLECHSMPARDWLFTRYHPWSQREAHSWQRKLFLSLADIDDFRQYASIGLLEAIANFNPKLGFAFVLFARFRVKGSILNEVFRFSEYSAQINAVYESVGQGADNNLSSAQSYSQLQDTIEEFAMSFLLSDTLVEQPLSWMRSDFYSSTELSFLKIRYFDMLLKFDDPIQSIMLLRYQLDWDFSHIASTIGLSRGRVSQLHKEAIEKLRFSTC